jgi:RNA polymerase sigma-70 factor (ECF subfamily)
VPSPLPRLELEELLRLARAGQGEALGRLLEEYRPYLLHIANAGLPDLLQAKLGGSDVVQETIVEALTCFANFHGQSLPELRGWLGTILKRRISNAADHYQGTAKRQAGREVPLASLGDSVNVEAGQPSPSSPLRYEEEVEQVRQALDRLPELYRQVLVWRQWEDLPFAEIARRLDRTVDAARMLWWRALERFHEEMGPDA